MSRLRIFVLLATVLALAGALTACGGGDEDPQEVVQNATLEGVESGVIDLALGIKSRGNERADLNVSLSGPFQGADATDPTTLPQLDLEIAAVGDVAGEPVDFQGGITVLRDRAFVDYKGTEYEVDPTTFGLVKSSIEGAQGEGGSEAADPTACQEAFSAIDLGTVVDNPVKEGDVDVDGTSTTKVSGELNLEGAIDAVIALTEDPACAAQIEATGQQQLDELDEIKGEADALRKGDVEIYVGDDDIVRKVVAELEIEPKENSKERVEIDLSLTLSGVNEEQTISAPRGAQPLEGLFKELGIDPLELLEASQNGGLGGLLEGLGGDSGEGPLGGIDLGDIPGTEFSQEYLECLEKAKTASDLQDCTSLLG